MISPLTIDFKYQLHGSQAWHSLDLAVEDYFDIDVQEPGEPLDIHSVAEYFDPRKYVNAEPAAIARISVTVTDTAGGRRGERHTYWNRGLCELILHESNLDGYLPWHMVLQCEVLTEPSVVVTAHFLRSADGLDLLPDGYLVSVDEQPVDDVFEFEGLREMWFHSLKNRIDRH